MQFESTILDNKTSYFSNFCANAQNTKNASIKFIKQNVTAQKTTAAVAKYAPYVIGFVGSYFAPVAVTAVAFATTFVIAKQRPQYISKQTFGKVTMGIGASMGLTSLSKPFLKMIACALASGVTLIVGAALNDLLPTKKSKSV